MKNFLLMCVVILTFTASSYAAPIDLSTWTAASYDVAGFQAPGNWDLSNNNETVTQTLNADPTMYLNNLNQTSYTMNGSWMVATGSDDDFMGFVFGYQDESHFYLMDWKQGSQTVSGYGTALEGFSIKKISANSKADLTLPDFWSSTDTTNTTILASNYNTSFGWADNTSYDFTLEFNADGSFSVLVANTATATTLWDVSVTDSVDAYTYGEFGFYNFSQQTVVYNGFEQEGGVIIDPVPEPATMLLFGLGLLGLAGVSRMKIK